MKYIGFNIKNYKGIKELKLDLNIDPKLNIFTLVGLNESGKTTILDAISLFQKDIPNDKRHTLIPKNKKTNFNDSVLITATISLDVKDEAKIKEFCKTKGIVDVVDLKQVEVTKKYNYKNSNYHNSSSEWKIKLIAKKKSSKAMKEYKYTDQIWQDVVAFIRENLFPKIIYYPNFLFDFPSKIYLQEFGGEKEEQATYRSVVQDILNSLNEGLTIEEHIVNRMKSEKEEDKESLDSTINKMSAKVTKIVFDAWSTLFKSEGKEIVIKPQKETVSVGERTEERYYIEVKLKEGSEQYQISERSLGFKWFFAFLLFTEFRKNRSGENGEILFLLDEPASNLHSTAQANLLKTFKDLVDKSKLIYTTHSHHLINPEWLEGAYIVKNKALDYSKEFDYDSSKTNIEAVLYRQFAMSSPGQQTYFQPILDSLDYSPSKLELVPAIVILEGKNDFYTFSYVNGIILDNKYSLNFYPGGGAGKNSQVIKLYLSWNRKFLVIMDSDAAGQSAQGAYEAELGLLVKDKILTLEDVNKSFTGISTEELFDSSEKMAIIQSLDSKAKSYSKTKFNLAVQNLLFFKSKITLSKSTLDKFEEIFNLLDSKF